MYGVDEQIAKIEENTKNFLEGLAFNHGLLWGVRGSGKSSIIRGILKDYSMKYENFVTIEINSEDLSDFCLLYTSPSPRDKRQSRMPSSA